MMDLRKHILEADDRKTEVVDVPQWGVQLRIRELSGIARAEIKSLWLGVIGENGKPTGTPRDIAALTVVHGIVDDAGNAVFTAADVGALLQKNGDAIERIYMAINRISGLGEEPKEDARKK